MRTLQKYFLQMLGLLFFCTGATQFLPLLDHKTRPWRVLKVKILNCYDGDTCTARSPYGPQMTFRLIGVDAPEMPGPRTGGWGQAFSRESRDYLRSRVVGRELWVEIVGRDPYLRYLGLFYENNRNYSINQELIEAGYAFAYRGPAPTVAEIRSWAESSEKQAKTKRRGLWGLSIVPEDPTQFRHRK